MKGREVKDRSGGEENGMVKTRRRKRTRVQRGRKIGGGEGCVVKGREVGEMRRGRECNGKKKGRKRKSTERKKNRMG